MEKYTLSKRSIERLVGVDKRLIKLIKRALKISLHDFGIPSYGGFRTEQNQKDLFKLKPSVTQLDGVIKKSYHQSGKAFDIFIFDEHGACWKCIDKYKEVSEIFKEEFTLMKGEGIFKEEENLYWGGDWKNFKDIPHFEMR